MRKGFTLRLGRQRAVKRRCLARRVSVLAVPMFFDDSRLVLCSRARSLTGGDRIC